MNAAQIDQSLEKLVQELQGFKRSANLLTDASMKAEEVTAAAEAAILLSGQIHSDNQRQVEAVQNYTTKSEQSLATLAASVTTAQDQQQETLAAFTRDFEKDLEALAESIDRVQASQNAAFANLEEALTSRLEDQAKSQRQQYWIIFTFVILTLICAGAALATLLISSGFI